MVSACVIDTGSGPQVCTFVFASYPPQGQGPPVHGWDWSRVEHAETGRVRWGDYVLYGTWDGQALTLTRPPVTASELVQRDPGGLTAQLRRIAGHDREDEEPPPAGARLGEDDLLRVSEEVGEQWADQPWESVGPHDGAVEVRIFFDDGTLQSRADATWGVGAVRVVPTLRPVEE